MTKIVPGRLFRSLFTAFLVLITCSLSSSAQTRKILGGYFEEWSIYYAGYNIANLQENGVANKLTHLFYAFANVTTDPAPACGLADTWADYQTPYLPSVSGAPYTGPLYGNFAAIQQLEQLHPELNVLISIGGASAANTAAFVTAASTAAGRQALAASCISLFIQGNIAPGIAAPGLFDGINIDWEFPTSSDTKNFSALLLEFRKQLNQLAATTGKRYILSFDGPAGAQNYVNIDLPVAASYVDFITIDGYNYAGSDGCSENGLYQHDGTWRGLRLGAEGRRRERSHGKDHGGGPAGILTRMTRRTADLCGRVAGPQVHDARIAVLCRLMESKNRGLQMGT